MWTSAGVTAGMDLALALVEDDHGGALALDVARRLVLFTRRGGGQAQFRRQLAVGRPARRRAPGRGPPAAVRPPGRPPAVDPR